MNVTSSSVGAAVSVAVTLASMWAHADEARVLTRADVIAEYYLAAANGTLRRNDYDYDARDYDFTSTRTRADVIAELALDRPDPTLVGPMRNRLYNPFGTEVLHVSTLPRAVVKAAVLEARRDGTLRRTDYDDEPAAGGSPRRAHGQASAMDVSSE